MMSKIVTVKRRGSGEEVEKAWVGYTVDGERNIVDQTARVVIPGKLDRLTDHGIANVRWVWLEADGTYTVEE